jgi:hypothetical protein
LSTHNAALLRVIALWSGIFAMGTKPDHRRFAEECVAMAHASESANDKALWITLAQSWVRLAEHVARTRAGREAAAIAGNEAVKEALTVQPAD